MPTPGDLALRLFLPCYFVAYIVIGGPLAVASVRRKYGIDPLVVRDPDPIMALGESYRNVIFAVALAVVFAYAVHPPVAGWLVPVSVLEIPIVRGIGVALLLASLVLVRASQVQLKGAWRFGFDRAEPSRELITTGLYAWSRNPIYVGMATTGAGFFLALPNALTFTIANLTVLLLDVRIRREEEHLRASHGHAFEDYCRRTPRWLFRRRPSA
jgi:protein-S-isoprenylcysteine O-methyltransferase Ste14